AHVEVTVTQQWLKDGAIVIGFEPENFVELERRHLQLIDGVKCLRHHELILRAGSIKRLKYFVHAGIGSALVRTVYMPEHSLPTAGIALHVAQLHTIAPGEVRFVLRAKRKTVNGPRDSYVRSIKRDVKARVRLFLSTKVVHLRRREELEVRLEIAGIDER